MCVRNFWINAIEIPKKKTRKRLLSRWWATHNTATVSNRRHRHRQRQRVPNVGKTRFDLFEYDIIKWCASEGMVERNKKIRMTSEGIRATTKKFMINVCRCVCVCAPVWWFAVCLCSCMCVYAEFVDVETWSVHEVAGCAHMILLAFYGWWGWCVYCVHRIFVLQSWTKFKLLDGVYVRMNEFNQAISITCGVVTSRTRFTSQLNAIFDILAQFHIDQRLESYLIYWIER